MDALFANADITITMKMILVTVLATVHIDSHVSSRLIEREIGIPRTTAL